MVAGATLRNWRVASMNGEANRRGGGFWGRAVRKFRGALAAPKPVPRQTLAPLVELEDRRLLSVTTVGSVFQVNTYRQQAQQTFSQQSVATNPTNGNFVVVWSSQGQHGGGGWDVYMQMYNAAGTPIGGETLVDTPVNGVNQQYAAVAMSANGNFVVTWATNDGGHWNIEAQIYNSSGVAQGAAIQVTTTAVAPNPVGDQTNPSVAMDQNGNFVITWSGHQSGNWNIYAEAFNASGTVVTPTWEVDVPVNGKDQEYANVAMSAAGNFVISWSGNQIGPHWEIYAQLYAASDTPVGSIFQVSSNTTDDQQHSIAAFDSSGNFIVVWQGHQGGHWNIYGQTYNSSGTAIASANFEIDTPNNNDQVYPSVAFGNTANPIIAWHNNVGGPTGWAVDVQQVTPTGALVGGELQVASQVNPNDVTSIAGDGLGDLVAVWNTQNPVAGESMGVFAQRLNTGVSSAGIDVTPTNLQTTQAGASASFTVDLASAPAATVTVNLTNDDPSQGSLSESTLTFTTSDWNTPQTVTVTGVNNNIAAGNQTYEITGLASSSDANYNNLAMTPVTVTNVQSDVPGIIVSGSTFLVCEDNNLVRINAQTGAIVATYATGLANDGVAVGANGDIYVANYSSNEVNYYSPAGTLLGSFGSSELISPQGLTFGPNGNLFVTCTNGVNGGFVDEFTPTGTFVTTFIAAGSGGLSNAKEIVWGPNGNAFVSAFDYSQILEYNGTTGAFIKVFASGGDGFEQIAFGPNGNLYAASYDNNAVYEFNGTTGAAIMSFSVATPYGVYFDPAGNLDVTSRSAGDILQYNANTGALIGTLDTGLTNPAYFAGTSSLTTTQSGGTATFTVQLSTEPVDPVTITLTVGNPAQGSVSTTTLTFDASDWNTPQTVTVTGLNNNVADGNVSYQITGTASSSDANYNGIAMAPVTVTNLQTDGPGVVVYPASIETSMSGASASFQVALTTEPVDSVTVTLTGDSSQGTLSTTTLTFTNSYWQTVTVTGVDDLLATGNVSYQITGSTSSSDPNYNGLAMQPVSVTNVDTNLPGFVITPTSLYTTQSGGASSFTVALAALPLGSVTLNLTNPDPTQGSLSTSSLTFSTLDWNTPQTVTVTGVNNDVADGNQTYQITGSAQSLLDLRYNGLAMTPITVTNIQTDVPGITVTPTSITTSQAGAAGSFSVSLATEPVGSDTVTVTLTGNPSQGSLSASTLTFNSSNWDTPQTVTVTGVNDNIAQGNVSYQITGIASSNEANYNNMIMTPVSVTNLGTDTAGFTVTPTTLTTSENGTTASFTVALTSQPTAPVTVSLQPSDPTQGSLSQSTLTFNASDWNVAQTVTVTGLDSYMTTPSQTYQITGSASSADANYDGMSTTPVTVTNLQTAGATSGTSIYGQAVTFPVTVSAVPPQTGTPTGTVTYIDGTTKLATVTLSGGSASYTTSDLFVGTHVISVEYSGDGTFLPITQVLYVQTVTPATLTVAANDASKVYGQANPTFSDTITGFVNGDTTSVVSGAASLTTNATTASGVGNYAITPSQGSLSAANYTFSFSAGNLSISAAPLTISANSKTMAYGSSVPGLNATFTGLVNGDSSSVVSGLVLATAATSHSNVGVYAINASGGTAANYAITDVNGTLTIAPATLTVAATDLTKIVGQANPPLADTISGFVNGQSASIVTGSPVLSTTATVASGVGSYPISIAAGTLAAPNYNFAVLPGTLTVLLTPPPASPPAASPTTTASSPTTAAPTTFLGLLVTPPAAMTTAANLAGVASVGTAVIGPGNARGVDSAGIAKTQAGVGEFVPIGDLSLAASSSMPIQAQLVNMTRTVLAFAPPPRLAWQEAVSDGHSADLPLADEEIRFETIPLGPIAGYAAAPQALAEPVGAVLDILSDAGERMPWVEPDQETSAILGVGVVATAGYVLMNSRLGLWALSLLTAQPLWRQFDPLEVLYAWEEEKPDELGGSAEDAETLVSLVEEW